MTWNSEQLTYALMATVLLLLLSAVTGATGFSSMNFMPRMKFVDLEEMPENTHGCPFGQIFCFRTLRCVNREDTSCPEIPNCLANQVVCNVGGNLECVAEGTCEKIDVKFKIQKGYDQVVGVNHGKIIAFMNNIRQKFAAELDRTISVIWGVEVHPGENAVWVTFNSVPDAEADLNDIFKNEKQQFLTDQDGLSLTIDFSQSVISKDCGTGQICWKTEEAQCVPENQCPVYLVEVTIDGDYGSTVGMDEEGFSRNLVSQLSDVMGVASEAFQHPSVHAGSIVFDFETSLPNIQQKVQDLINNGDFPKDLAGTLLTVTGLTVTLITGDGSSGNGPGDWKFDWHMPFEENDDYCVPGECTRCQPGEEFCLMSQRCIKPDGTCATNDECEATEETCWDQFTGEPYCMAVGTCTLEEIQATFTLEGECTAIEHENVFKDLLRTQLAMELQISESDITNLEITCGPIVVTFEIHGGSPAALSDAVHALKALVERKGPLGPDDNPILPTSLRLGNCERDSDGHCMEQCPAPEVPCWDDSGQSYCEFEALCTTTAMEVSFHMDGEMTTVDPGTDAFTHPLKTALSGLFGITEDVISSLEVSLSDDGYRLVVKLQIKSPTPAELDDVLKTIKESVESGGSLNVNGFDYGIVPDTLHFGIDSDCPRDGSGNCMHVPDDCPDTEVKCWLPDGTSYCDFEESCTETTMSASLHLGGGTSSVDLGTDAFKMSLKTELAGQLGIPEAVLLNFEVLNADSALKVNFLVGSSSPVELNSILKSIKGIADGSQPLTVNGIEYWITAVHFGTSADCPKDSSGNCVPRPDNCPVSEEPCWDTFTGELYCIAGICTDAAMQATFTLDGDCTAVGSDDGFKDLLRVQLAMNLQISESEITNLEIECGSIVVKFEIHSHSPAALGAALYTLKVLVDSEGPLQVGPDAYPILPMSLRLGNCERDSEGHCVNVPEQCQAPEVTCWYADGTPYCDVQESCTVTTMPVFFHLVGDTSMGPGTAFEMSLQTTLAVQLGITVADLLNFEVLLSGDGALDVHFNVERSSPTDLNDILKRIKEIADGSQPLDVNGIEYWISALHFGTGAAPGGTCPDPGSALFTWSCDAACTEDQGCTHGTLCCYSEACQNKVCVAPEGATAPDGVCPASNSHLLTGSGICGNAKTCQNPSDCDDSGEEEICCYSDECGDQICIEKPDPGSGWDHSGSGSGWELPHFGSGSESGDGCAEGENCIRCPPGQMICFMTGTCVDIDRPCKDEDPATGDDCTTDEDVCWDMVTGTKGCVEEKTCETTSMRGEIVFDGDFVTITDLEAFKSGLSTALANRLQINPGSLHLLEIKAGSIIVVFEMRAEIPDDLNDILTKLEHMIEEGGVLDVLGIQLLFSAGSLQLGGPAGCAHIDSSGTCVECVSPEMWCPDQLMCKTDCTPEPEVDVFHISFELDTVFDYFASSGIAGSFVTDVMQDMVRSRLEQLEGAVRQQLKLFFSDTEAEIHRVTALPTRTEEDGKYVILWTRISTPKDSVTQANLENKLAELELTGIDGNSVTFTYAVYQLPDEPIKVLIVPQPFVMGKEMDLNIREIIPQSMREKLPEAIRESFPSQTSITCEEDTNVFFPQPGGTTEVQAVTLDATTQTVKLIHRNQEIELVSCSIFFSELETASQVTKEYKLGLLAVPDEVQKLAQPGSITLAKSMIEQDEDTDCRKLPENLFSIEFPGDALVSKFDYYAKNMIENGEKWVGDDLSQTIQSLLVDFVANKNRSLASTRYAYVKISDNSVYTENQKMVARLKWKQGSQESVLTQAGKGGKTDLLATRDNLKMCVKEDYNGEFILEITPADLHKPFDTLQLPVLVNSVNDAPVVKEDIKEILSSLEIGYPRVKQTNDPDITPLEISPTELARQLFSDQKDGNDNLGLVLLGAIIKSNGVGGDWEYKPDAGADWMPVREFSPPNLDGATNYKMSVPVVHLGEESMLRFTLDPAFESMTWKRSAGPGIKLAGLDLTLDLDPNLGDTMMLHYCETGSKKLCGPGNTTVWSEAIVDFLLPRYGCDGKINSGSEQLNALCGCDQETCPDCKGDDGGNADWDKCGICATPNEALTIEECCLLEHRDEVDESWKEYCDEQDRIEEELKCPIEGEVKNLCGDCVATGSDLSGKDECDVPCGDNTKCADCFGQPNGDAMINPCGECKNELLLNEGCEIGMKHEPKFDYTWLTSSVWLTVTEALSSTPVADISCSLIVIEGGPVVPEVTSVEFETSDSSGDIDGNIIKLTMKVSETEAENSAGKYDISCQFESTQVKISDSDNNEHYTRLNHPKLEALSPATALIADPEIIVTIDGVGFVDTGKLFCVIPCTDLKMYNCRKSANGIAYYTTPAEYVDESTVTCDLSRGQKLERGGTVNINVILGEESMVDMAKLPTALTFTVRMPAPKLESAVLDGMGCNSIYVEFDKYIRASVGREGPCSQFFRASGATIASGVNCYLKGKMIVMEFNDGASMLTAGTELSLLDNVIYDPWVAGENNANNLAITFATGTVTIAEPDEKIQPDVSLVGPDTVGNQPDYLKVKILNRGCLRFILDWSVEAVNPEPSNTELTGKVTALNNYLQGLKTKRLIRIGANQLVSGEEFIFTLAWRTKQYESISGIITHTISQDDNKQITAEITGLQNEKVDIREPLKLVAVAEINTDQFSEDVDSFIYEWTVLPSIDRKFRNAPWLWFPAYSLRADDTYTVKLKVSYGDISHETKITFETLSKPLEAKINGDDEEELMCPYNKDLTLTATESEDPDRSEDEDVFTWTCMTNLGISNPQDLDSFRPCMELDVNGNSIPVEREGDTVELLAAERNSPTGSLWQLWKLRWQKGKRSSATEKLIKFEEVISVPKIVMRTKRKLTVGANSDRKIYRIRAYCKAKTGHSWRGDQGKDYPELDVSAVAKSSEEIEKQYGSNFDINRYKKCSIVLDFSKPEAAQFINGDTYKLTVTAYSQYLSSNKPSWTSKSIIIETWTNPVAGTIEVSPADPTISSYEAMKTKFQVYLDDWLDPRDGSNLKCWYFYKASGSVYERIDHKLEPMDKRSSFVLPEGIFTFKATCCNTQDLCASATSDNTITVEPVDIAAEEASGEILTQVKIAVKAVATALQAVTNLLRYASKIATTASAGYRDKVKQTLKTGVNDAILNTVPEDSSESGVEETVSSMKKSVDVLKEYNKPSEMSRAVAMRLMLAALGASNSFIGRSGSTSKRRRKRNVVTNDEDSDGLTESQAEDILYVFEMCGSDSDAFEAILDETLADGLKDTIDNVMEGMCIAYNDDGSTAWNAEKELVTVQLKKHSLQGAASAVSDVVDSRYTEAALITYGADLAAEYDDSWECSNETVPCTDVCIATAQLGVDIITKTASFEITAPIRQSDLVITKLINPEDTAEELIVENLANPLVITISTYANDLTDFDLLCMMWIDENWSDSTCNTGVPSPGATTYQVECSCSQTGILGVFQTEKSNTSVVIGIITTTAPNVQKPSKQLKSNTVSTTCQFTLTEDFDAQLALSSQEELEDHFEQGLGDQTGYGNSIKNVRIERGSIVVIFDLYRSSAPGSDTLGEMLAAIENMVQSGTLVLTNPNGDTLTILTNSFTYEENSDEDDDDKSKSALPYILGGVLGGLAIIGLFVVLTIIAIKKTRGNRTRPNTPVSPAPAYDNAKPIYPNALPPPYSALSTPSKDKLYPEVEKWTENELKVAHPDAKKAPRSIGSASSTERRLIMTLEEERQPTPVDN